MKKLAPGYYTETYKGFTIEICKTETGNNWFYLVSGGKFGETAQNSDHLQSKATAQAIARDFCENSEYMPGLGWCYTGNL